MLAISQRRRACKCCMLPLATLHGRLLAVCCCMRRCPHRGQRARRYDVCPSLLLPPRPESDVRRGCWGRQLKCDNPCESCRNRRMRVGHGDSEHVCEVRSYGKLVYAYEKRSPHHPVSRCLSGMLLGAAPRPRKRAGRRTVGPTRWLSIVHIHTRPR